MGLLGNPKFNFCSFYEMHPQINNRLYLVDNSMTNMGNQKKIDDAKYNNICPQWKNNNANLIQRILNKQGKFMNLLSLHHREMIGIIHGLNDQLICAEQLIPTVRSKIRSIV